MNRMQKKWSNFFWILTIFFSSFSSSLLAADKNPQWEVTSAKFTLIFEDIKNLKTDDTMVGSLIKATDQKLENLLEGDGKTLVSFKLEYRAPVRLAGEKQAKNKTIIQYGLYKTLAPEIQQYIGRKEDEKAKNIMIQYAKEDPIAIRFIIDGKLLPAPVLLTQTIDAGWSAKQN